MNNINNEKDTYMENRKKEIRAHLGENLENFSKTMDECLYMTVVTFANQRYIICTLSDAENKELYPDAKVERMFGKRFKMDRCKLIEQYKKGPTFPSYETSLGKAVKEYLLVQSFDDLYDYFYSSNIEGLPFVYKDISYEIHMTDFLSKEKELDKENEQIQEKEA